MASESFKAEIHLDENATLKLIDVLESDKENSIKSIEYEEINEDGIAKMIQDMKNKKG